MILINVFFAVVFGLLTTYTFYLAIKIMLMSTSEYTEFHKQLHDRWVKTEDGTLMIKRSGVGIKRKLKSKEKNLKNNELDF